MGNFPSQNLDDPQKKLEEQALQALEQFVPRATQAKQEAENTMSQLKDVFEKTKQESLKNIFVKLNQVYEQSEQSARTAKEERGLGESLQQFEKAIIVLEAITKEAHRLLANEVTQTTKNDNDVLEVAKRLDIGKSTIYNLLQKQELVSEK